MQIFIEAFLSRVAWVGLVILVAASPVMSLAVGRGQDPCSQKLLVRGGNQHLSLVGFMVLVALDAEIQNLSKDLASQLRAEVFTALAPVLERLRGFDAEHFANWQADINLFGAMKNLEKRGFVHRGVQKKPTVWQTTPAGRAVLATHLGLFHAAYELGVKRRNEGCLESGPFAQLQPGRPSLRSLRESYDQEFAMVFVMLNSLERDRELTAAQIAERVQGDFPDAGFWVEQGMKSAYPSAMRPFLERLQRSQWISARSGPYRSLYYKLETPGVIAIFELRAFFVDVFLMLASSTSDEASSL